MHSADKSNLVAHYNPRDILKNRIDHQSKELKPKYNTQKLHESSRDDNSNRVFATEP